MGEAEIENVVMSEVKKLDLSDCAKGKVVNCYTADFVSMTNRDYSAFLIN